MPTTGVFELAETTASIIDLNRDMTDKMPVQKQQSSLAERISAGLLLVCFAALGWLTLWQGGVALKGKSGLVTFVDGRPGRVVAALCFCAAAIGLLMLLRTFRPGRLVNLVALLLLMVPPLLYVVARH